MQHPVMVTTWKFGLPACAAGLKLLNDGASALDAVEAAAHVVEDDPEVQSVGFGGLPNAEGIVELDAAIMDGVTHSAGCVAGLTRTMRPISVARRVMERTPHTMLVGDNAVRFARSEGFGEADLLTKSSNARWSEWKTSRAGADVAHFDTLPAAERGKTSPKTPTDHDTIGICALDQAGNLAAGCTTSGMAWKQPGRVGDSPIIGSGLYVDNMVGAAAATGHGDEMMKACLSYRVVMLMEQGRTPSEACAEALRYLLEKRPPELHGHYGAALIALRSDGAFGAGATRSGFSAPDHLWHWASGTADDIRLREGPYIALTTVEAAL